MLTPEELVRIWEAKRSLMEPYWKADGFDFRAIWQRLPQYRDKQWDHPELWPGYNNACREREKIRPHIEHGFYPERLFKERAPNESEKEAAYMKANFRQVTLSHYDDFQNSILRALHENNWSISYAEEEDEENTFKAFVTTGLPEFGSVLNYVRYIVPKSKTLDAMGLIAVLPDKLPTVVNDEGAEVIAQDGEIVPIPQYIPVNKVWGFEYDRWYLWLTNESIPVTRGSRTVNEGLVLVLVDDTNAYRISQVGEKHKFEFKIDLWWAHGLGYAPAIHLRGNPKQTEDGAVVWQSPYLSAVEPLDQVLLDTSYLGASKAKCVFPHQVQIGDDCEFVDPQTGAACGGTGELRWTESPDDGPPIWKTSPCRKCHGTGMKSRMGPLGTLLVRPASRMDDRTEIPNVSEALSFVGPDVSSLQFLRKEVESNTIAARAMLHLSTEQQVVEGGDAKTATQSGIDLRGHYAFIKPISDQVFDIFQFVMETIGKMRYGPAFTGVSITRPVSFDIRTEMDMVEEIKASRRDADLPPAMVETLIWNYTKARNQHDPDGLMVMETIAAADDLFAASTASVQFQLSQKLIEPWQVVLHNQAVSIYDEMVRSGKLMTTADQNADVQANKLTMQAIAKARTPKQELPAANRLAEAITR